MFRLDIANLVIWLLIARHAQPGWFDPERLSGYDLQRVADELVRSDFAAWWNEASLAVTVLLVAFGSSLRSRIMKEDELRGTAAVHQAKIVQCLSRLGDVQEENVFQLHKDLEHDRVAEWLLHQVDVDGRWKYRDGQVVNVGDDRNPFGQARRCTWPLELADRYQSSAQARNDLIDIWRTIDSEGLRPWVTELNRPYRFELSAFAPAVPERLERLMLDPESWKAQVEETAKGLRDRAEKLSTGDDPDGWELLRSDLEQSIQNQERRLQGFLATAVAANIRLDHLLHRWHRRAFRRRSGPARLLAH